MRFLDRSLRFALASSLLVSGVGAFSSALPPTDECDGCFGSADADYDSSPACPGAYVSIDVSVSSAMCIVVSEGVCVVDNCETLVARQWGGLNPNSEMNFCNHHGGFPRLCMDTDLITPGVQGPSSGPDGDGYDSQNPLTPCGSGNSQYSITGRCPGGLLNAVAVVACTDHCS